MTGRVSVLALCAALLLGGCAGRGPMTASEFMGFCSSEQGKRGNCDSLGICDEYLQEVGRPQESLQGCLKNCADAARAMAKRRAAGQCQATVNAGNDWCQRYCRTLYPE